MAAYLPELYVEGRDDIIVISSLLLRHGIDTDQGGRHLKIRGKGGVDQLLGVIGDAIRASSGRPVGFVLDIDIEVSNRWTAVRDRLREAGLDPPAHCPQEGYVEEHPQYHHRCGVWLMPDCQTDHAKLEDLIATLVPENDPLWPHAQECTTKAATIVEEHNARSDAQVEWTCFKDVDRSKAEVHAWLAWQRSPGVPFGTALKGEILGHDSDQAKSFLRWLGHVYEIQKLKDL